MVVEQLVLPPALVTVMVKVRSPAVVCAAVVQLPPFEFGKAPHVPPGVGEPVQVTLAGPFAMVHVRPPVPL
jgi:hypothetical protein